MDAACTIQDSIHVFSLVRKYVSRILGTYQNYNCTKGINIISGGYFYVKIYYGVRRRNHQQPVYSL